MAWYTSVITSASTSILWLLLLVVIVGVVGVGLYAFFQWKVYNKTVVVFENIAGKGYVVTFKDKARLVKFGKTGEEVLFLKKKKLYRTAYGRKMGNNQYWFAIGQDGLWYNFVLGDLDAKKEMLDIEPVDRDVRMTYVAMGKLVDEKFKDKKSFMEEYGPYLINGIVVIMVIAGMWFLIDKTGKNLEESELRQQDMLKTQTDLASTNQKIVASLENMVSTSGLRPVSTTGG